MMRIVSYCQIIQATQPALAPDAAPLRFAAQVKRKPLCAGDAAREVGMVDRCGGWAGVAAS